LGLAAGGEAAAGEASAPQHGRCVRFDRFAFRVLSLCRFAVLPLCLFTASTALKVSILPLSERRPL